MVKLFVSLMIALSFSIGNAEQVTGWENHNYLSDKFERKFSKFSKLGELTQIYFPLLATSSKRFVVIDDKYYKLTPGVRFYTQKNNLIIPPSNTETPAQVAYIEVNGYINRVWVLTEEEADDFEDYKFK